jgi:hypothetical protein
MFMQEHLSTAAGLYAYYVLSIKKSTSCRLYWPMMLHRTRNYRPPQSAIPLLHLLMLSYYMCSTLEELLRASAYVLGKTADGIVRHPNIVCLHCYSWTVDEKLLIYEYLSNGSLETALHGKHVTDVIFTTSTFCIWS